MIRRRQTGLGDGLRALAHFDLVEVDV
jgi:hypothetical protein